MADEGGEPAKIVAPELRRAADLRQLCCGHCGSVGSTVAADAGADGLQHQVSFCCEGTDGTVVASARLLAADLLQLTPCFGSHPSAADIDADVSQPKYDFAAKEWTTQWYPGAGFLPVGLFQLTSKHS